MYSGTYAIVSLMVISSINRYSGILYPSQTDSAMLGNSSHGASGHASSSHGASPAGNPANYISNDPVQAKLLIAMTLSIVSGVIQVIFSVLHIGFVTKYLSDSIVNGFTTGAAFHVVVSQISTLLGIKLGDNHIMFVIVGVSISITISKVILSL